MDKSKDVKTVYDLLFGALKDALGDERPDPKILKLALDFVKAYPLEADVNINTERDATEFLSNLPFKKVQ